MSGLLLVADSRARRRWKHFARRRSCPASLSQKKTPITPKDWRRQAAKGAEWTGKEWGPREREISEMFLAEGNVGACLQSGMAVVPSGLHGYPSRGTSIFGTGTAWQRPARIAGSWLVKPPSLLRVPFLRACKFMISFIVLAAVFVYFGLARSKPRACFRLCSVYTCEKGTRKQKNVRPPPSVQEAASNSHRQAGYAHASASARDQVGTRALRLYTCTPRACTLYIYVCVFPCCGFTFWRTGGLFEYTHRTGRTFKEKYF